MYHTSAKLSAWCCKKYEIPIDRKHIIGHSEVPGCSGSGGGVHCHTDPGLYWNWKKYMRLIEDYWNLL
jgi:N-acetyl-anhydromuramyl-L-alanine amidase AmpD